MLIEALTTGKLGFELLRNTSDAAAGGGGDTGGVPAGDGGAGDGGKGDVDVPEQVLGGDTAEGEDTAGTAAQGGKPEAPAEGDKPAEGEGDEDGVPEGDYAFDLGEGRELDAKLVAEFSPILKELGVGQKAANTLATVLDKALQAQADADIEAAVAQTKAWRDAAKADPEIGQGNWDATVKGANKALQRFGTPQLTEVLKVTGLGNHPEVIRLFARLEKSVGDDKLDPGNVTTGARDLPAEQRWYGSKK